MRRTAREYVATPALFVLLALFLAGFVAVYAAALGAGPGARADRDALESQAAWQLGVPGPLNDLLGTISVGSLGLAALVAVAVALWRRRPDVAVAVVVVLVGANVTTQVLKEVLATADPLALDSERAFASAFPSGHSTAAASVGLVAVMAVAPELRRATATIAVIYAVGVGIATVALGWHYPSDVLGGYLVAGAWAAAVAAVLGLRHPEPSAAGLRGFAAPAMVGLVAAALGTAAVLLDRAAGEFVFITDNTSFVAAATLIALAGAMVIAAVAAQLDARRDL
ncbi:MAG: phosphatase PAP2 family protein [Thermoleophilia bacterium]|nr:phosphatase PAP2 family protein [Thermoleophilia bacterium]MDH3725337.1 phosphatase PAP2 family protein [Thermoleophilia bacterium]